MIADTRVHAASHDEARHPPMPRDPSGEGCREAPHSAEGAEAGVELAYGVGERGMHDARRPYGLAK